MVKVIMTRTTDKYLSLNERARISNRAKADIFVSIHNNSATNTSAHGLETFHHTGSKKGPDLAKSIQNNVWKTGLFKSNRGVKHANFAVLRETKAPAALVELGFISNAREEKEVLNKEHKLMAKGIADGIKAYLKGKKNAIVCLDAGHGGSDPGAVGRVLRLYEKDVVLKVALEVKRLLEGEKVTVKPSTPKPANKPVVDRRWGPETTKALQRHYGTVVDGKITGQPNNQTVRNVPSATTAGTGSMLIRAMQKDLGTVVDGKLSHPSLMIRALQKRMGTVQDGKISYHSLVVGEMQKRLNNGTF